MSLNFFVEVLQVAEAVSLEQERNSMSTAGGLYYQLVSFACGFRITMILNVWRNEDSEKIRPHQPPK